MNTELCPNVELNQVLQLCRSTTNEIIFIASIKIEDVDISLSNCNTENVDIYAICWIVGIFAVVLLTAVKVVGASQRLVVLEFGVARKVSGPGVVLTLPFLQTTKKVDIGVRQHRLPSIKAESFRENLVEGFVRFEIVDALKSCSVTDVDSAVLERAKKILAKEIPNLTVTEVFCQRDEVCLRVRKLLNAKTMTFGVKVIELEIQSFPQHERIIAQLIALLFNRTRDIYSLIAFLA